MRGTVKDIERVVKMRGKRKREAGRFVLAGGGKAKFSIAHISAGQKTNESRN